ncbi:MAG: thioredoxin [Clostridia bacterium]|nr:thioredoxin [Clostridia bacterium]
MTVKLNPENFAQLSSPGSLPLVIKFFATWCGPCKMFAPIYESTAPLAEGKAVFAEADIDRFPELAEKFGVMSVPTVVLVRDGKPIKKQVGMMSANQLLDFIGE